MIWLLIGVAWAAATVLAALDAYRVRRARDRFFEERYRGGDFRSPW